MSVGGSNRLRNAFVCGLVLGCLAPDAGAGGAASSNAQEDLIFLAEVEKQWDVFAWSRGASAEPRNLTRTALDEHSPTVSADGKFLVYGDSAGDYWVLSLRTGEPRRITRPEDRRLYLQPSLGVDGSAVLFAKRADPSRDDTDIAWVVLDGPDAEIARGLGPAWRQTNADSLASWALPMESGQFYPAIDGTGRRMAFVHLHCRWAGRVIAEVWEATIDHSYARQLTLSDGLCTDPAWAPDQSKIAYSSNQPGQFDVFWVDLASRKSERLSEDPAADTDPSFSRDGRFLAFVSMRTGAPGIWLLNVESRSLEQLRPFADGDRPCAAPEWQ